MEGVHPPRWLGIAREACPKTQPCPGVPHRHKAGGVILPSQVSPGTEGRCSLAWVARGRFVTAAMSTRLQRGGGRAEEAAGARHLGSPKPLWCRERSGVLALGGYACPGPTAVVAAPCPQGEWARVKVPGRGRPPAWELTKQRCSSLRDWKQLPVGHRQPDVAGTGRTARGDRLMQTGWCRGSPKPSWYPLVLAGSRAGEAEAPRTGCGLLAHLPSWVGGFSPSRGSGAECQPAREAAANTFFAIFSSEASCCWFQRIFFSSQ